MDTALELDLLNEDSDVDTYEDSDGKVHPMVFDDAEAELYYTERGKNMPSMNHSILQMLIGAALLRDGRYTVASELSLELDGWRSVPDIAVYPYRPTDWFHDTVRSTEPPLLTVEIVSPKQGSTELGLKAEKYLAHGVQSCWIVQPNLRIISVMNQATKLPVTFANGVLTDTVMNISLRLEEIFR
jgi:hypothetical protein